MKLNRKTLRKIILQEIKLLNEDRPRSQKDAYNALIKKYKGKIKRSNQFHYIELTKKPFGSAMLDFKNMQKNIAKPNNVTLTYAEDNENRSTVSINPLISLSDAEANKREKLKRSIDPQGNLNFTLFVNNKSNNKSYGYVYGRTLDNSEGGHTVYLLAARDGLSKEDIERGATKKGFNQGVTGGGREAYYALYKGTTKPQPLNAVNKALFQSAYYIDVKDEFSGKNDFLKKVKFDYSKYLF